MEKWTCFVAGMVTMAIIMLICRRRQEKKCFQENRELSRINGWLQTALAGMGVDVPEYIKQARAKVEFIPTWSPDPMPRWRKVVAAIIGIGCCLVYTWKY